MDKHQSQRDLRPAFRPSRLAACVAAAILAQGAQAAISISTSPLLTDSAVAPNIMFVQDDSGSMQWEIMPDDITYFAYLFPIPSWNGGSAIYGASDYYPQVPNFNSNNFYNYYLRSPNNNRVFYDPRINYTPWLRSVGGVSVPVTGDASGNIAFGSAPYNAAAAARGTLVLDGAAATSRSADWYSNGTGGCSGSMSCSFWPITFYMHDGVGSVNSQSSYIRYQIRNGVAYRATNAGAGAEAVVGSLTWTAADGSTITRTPAEERQNFANWFSYYRSRLLAARGGASLAFSELGNNFRVGFTTINHRGEASYTLKVPTSGTFSGTNRQSWFDKLLDTNVSTSGTPLRRALQWAGEYYSKGIGDAENPWQPFTEAECRRSFTILTTDGYWNGPDPSPAVGNSDGSNGPTHTSNLDDVANGGYVAGPPWADSYSETLADVAMHYWKNDLQSSVPNKVRPSPKDTAFWQRMNTFTLSIGVQGSLDPQTVLGNPSFASWPNPTGANQYKVDDLLHAAMNGRGEFVPASNPEEFKNGLRSALEAINKTAGSASSLSGNSTSVTTGSILYQAKYSAGSWSGDLVAWSLGADGKVQFTVDGNGKKRGKWAASEEMPAPDSRKIYTSLNGTGGSLTEFVSSNGSVAAAVGGANIVNYIRGSAADEGAGSSKLRIRVRNPKNAGDVVSPLGDIVNSSPAFVGAPPNRLYDRTSIPGAGSYQAHRSNNKNRKPLVYVGANDGMLHAFDADTGREVFAYIPSTVLPKLKSLSAQDYAHQFYVDGDVTVEDVFDGSKWRTILVASLGRGDKSMFALDVTNPVNSDGTPNVSSATLLWEIKGDASNKLGHALGTPMIAPMNNGKFGVILGNGYNGSTDTANLVVLDAVSGAVLQVMGTDSTVAHGLSGAGGWDDDGDGDVDLLYAGDLAGRLWKFDVSDKLSNKWTTANKSGSSFTPVINVTAGPNGGGKVQPITAAPTVGAHPDTGDLWIFFGTGKFIEAADRGDASVQTWYGVRDKIVDDEPNKNNRHRGALIERVIKEEGDVTRVDGSKGRYRLISDIGDTVGGAAIQDSTGKYLKQGWFLDLKLHGTTGAGERMLVRNILLKDILLGSTLIPNTAPCGELGDGWLMAIYPWLGGRPRKDFFDVNGDGTVDKQDSVKDQTVTGYKYGNGGVPFIQQCKEGLCISGSSTDGEEPPVTINAQDSGVRGRLSWRELLGE